MGFWGALIMSFFGTIFVMSAIVVLSGFHSAYLVAPPLFLAVFLAYALRGRKDPSRIRQPSERAGRIIMWCSIGEGVAIFIAVNVVSNLGHPQLTLPVIALVVGLHFLPMAYAIPFWQFYALSAALIIGSAIGMVLASPLGSALAGFIAGVGLWTAATLAIRREAHADALEAH